MSATRAAPRAPSLAAQWTGLLLPPVVFFAHLQGAYALVPRACRYHADVWLHVVGVASVVLAAFGTLVAWRVWRATTAGRAHFLGVTGAIMGGGFVLLLLAQWIAAFVISPCQ